MHTMATTRLFLDKTAVKKDGTAPIKIILSQGRNISKVPTGVDVPPAWWNEKTSTISSKHVPLDKFVDILIINIQIYFYSTNLESGILVYLLHDQS